MTFVKQNDDRLFQSFLRLFPEPVHLFQVGIGEGLTLLSQTVFDVFEASFELLSG